MKDVRRKPPNVLWDISRINVSSILPPRLCVPSRVLLVCSFTYRLVVEGAQHQTRSLGLPVVAGLRFSWIPYRNLDSAVPYGLMDHSSRDLNSIVSLADLVGSADK